MKKVFSILFFLLSVASFSQKEKLLGKWEIYLNTAVDVSSEFENDAKVKFLPNQTVEIKDDGKKIILSWELKNEILTFGCTKENNFPRFCESRFRIEFDEKDSTMILINVDQDKSFTLKKQSNSH